jgi:hypothetical protein
VAVRLNREISLTEPHLATPVIWAVEEQAIDRNEGDHGPCMLTEFEYDASLNFEDGRSEDGP